jgi:hypothetical protein
MTLLGNSVWYWKLTSPDGSWSESSLLWEIKPSLGKGEGVFATRLIEAGTRVIMEDPLFAIRLPEFHPGKGFSAVEVTELIAAAVAELSEESQAAFRSCHEHRSPDEDNSELRDFFIFRSNAYSLPDGRSAIFPLIAKINHACNPNIANIWDPSSGKRIIWAAKDIQPGEELTATYIPLLTTTEFRQQRLGQYGFQCDCDICSNAERTDRRRSRMGTLLAEIRGGASKQMSSFDSKIMLSRAEKLIFLLEEEHLVDYLTQVYRIAAEVSVQLGRDDDAVHWLQKELQLHQNAGQDTLAAQEVANMLHPAALP